MDEYELLRLHRVVAMLRLSTVTVRSKQKGSLRSHPWTDCAAQLLRPFLRLKARLSLMFVVFSDKFSFLSFSFSLLLMLVEDEREENQNILQLLVGGAPNGKWHWVVAY